MHDNIIIDTILSHRSIRSFLDKALSDGQIKLIVTSAQAASTSSFVQAYTIIGIKDKAKKAELARFAGNQSYVANNGHFFVFCLDIHRLELAAKMENHKFDEIQDSLESTELFMVGLIDAALAAQNAAIAAESMGLGVCYIGGLRNDLHNVSKLLKTPDYVVPLFGMCVGYPDNITGQKQRLPYAAIYHEDEYLEDEQIVSLLEQYNEDISAYYQKRTAGKRTDSWTRMMANKLTNASRLYMKDYLATKKLPLK